MARREAKFTIRGEDRSREATDSAKRNMKGVEDSAERLGNTLKSAFTVGAIVAVGKIALNVGADLVRAYAQQEEAVQKLNAAIEANPLLDSGASQRIQRFASELQKVTVVGDEVTLSFAGMLASFGRTEEEIENIIRAAVDLSAATGVSLETAVRNLNKTFGGLTGELGELIPELKDLTAEQLKQGDAVRVVTEMFEGMGEELTQTTNGAMQQFANAWGDLKETIGGGALAPVFNQALDWMTSLVEQTNAFVSAIFELNNAFNALDMIVNENATGPEDVIKQGFSPDTYQRALTAQEARIEEVQRQLRQQRGLRDQARQRGAPNTVAYDQRINELLNTLAMEEDFQYAIVRALQAASEAAARQVGSSPPSTEESTGGGGEDEAVKHVGKRLASLLDKDGVGEKASKVADSLTMMETQLDTTSLMFDSYYMGVNQLNDVIRNKLIVNVSDAAAALFDFEDNIDHIVRGTGSQVGIVGESLTEGVAGAAGSTFTPSGGGGGHGIVGDALGAAIDPLTILISSFAELAAQIESLLALTAPLKIIFDGILDVIGPVIDEALAPLIGIFYTLGQMIGQLLLPVIELLTPVIELLGKVFVWLYNKIFVPVHNGIREFGNKVYNAFASMINWIIGILNKLPGVNISGVAMRDSDYGKIGEIDYGDLSSTGAGYLGGGGGNDANYTTGRNITINMVVNTDALVGSDGIREFALMIRNEIYEAEALGA